MEAVRNGVVLCDQPRLRPLRDASETRLIITATEQTVDAGEGTAPFAYPDWQPRGSRKPITGQVVILGRVSGRSAELVESAAGAYRRAVLVPWDHDSGCGPIPWMQPSRWITPGEVGFVAAILRSRSRWVKGMPTFDVRDAWREPCTVARMKLLTANMPEAARAIMTPAEYGSLYAALPEISEWRRSSRDATRDLRDWRERNPSLAAKYPARWTLETTLRWVESEGR